MTGPPRDDGRRPDEHRGEVDEAVSRGHEGRDVVQPVGVEAEQRRGRVLEQRREHDERRDLDLRDARLAPHERRSAAARSPRRSSAAARSRRRRPARARARASRRRSPPRRTDACPAWKPRARSVRASARWLAWRPAVSQARPEPSRAKRAGTVRIVKSAGSTASTSSQRIGVETRASGTPRTEYAAAIVWSRAFWL